MRLEQGRFYPLGRDVDTHSSRGRHPIDTSEFSWSIEPTIGSSGEHRLQEIRFSIKEEGGREKREKESSPKTDGFEPFVDPYDPLKPPQSKEGELFFNWYGGNYAQRMELNRKGVERALRIAHLDGQVFITNLVPSRQRSAEAQGNELAAKRNLFFGEKMQDDKENPLYRVVSVPQGWRIEINDTRLTEELTEKRKLSGQELQRTFIRQFNSVLRQAVSKCVLKEKLSRIKDRHYRARLLYSITVNLLAPSLVLSSQVAAGHVAIGITIAAAQSLGATSFLNLLTHSSKNNSNMPSDYFSVGRKNVDYALEYFMPSVEIDKVVRTFAYLSGKGRRLVRGAQKER